MKELERITDQSGLREYAESAWKVLVPKIIAQARLEDHNKGVTAALKMMEDFGVKGMYGCNYMCGYVLYNYVYMLVVYCVTMHHLGLVGSYWLSVISICLCMCAK